MKNKKLIIIILWSTDTHMLDYDCAERGWSSLPHQEKRVYQVIHIANRFGLCWRTLMMSDKQWLYFYLFNPCMRLRFPQGDFVYI